MNPDTFYHSEISPQLRKSHCYAVIFNESVFNVVSSLKRLIVEQAFKYLFCSLCINIEENIYLHISRSHASFC